MSRLLRALAQSVAVLLALLLFVCAMVVVQAQRDELRPADLAIVVDAGRGPEESATQAALDRALLMQRRGYVRQILLAGEGDMAAAQRYMVGRGAPAELILVARPAASLPDQLAEAAARAREAAASQVIVIAQPSETLRALKIARDLDMDAYGSPARPSLRGQTYLDLTRDTLREAWAYLGYLLIGR
jgi:uncharacterized SAM-binding protein YcdF (DUF218 family)